MNSCLHKDSQISKFFTIESSQKLITGSGIADDYEYLIFCFYSVFFFSTRCCHLSNILISQLGAVIFTAISPLSPPSPHRLWVSDSSSLPVTARCLDFELLLFTPLSVFVVVIVARRQADWSFVMVSQIAAFKDLDSGACWIFFFIYLTQETSARDRKK